MFDGIAVFGGGGHSKSLIEEVVASEIYSSVLVFDDRYNAVHSETYGRSTVCRLSIDMVADCMREGAQNSVVLHMLHLVERSGCCRYLIGIGGQDDKSLVNRICLSNSWRHRLTKVVGVDVIPASPVISSSACVSKTAKILDGVFVARNASLGSDVKVGLNAIINTGSVIEHDSTVGEGAHIGPSAVICGDCSIGDFAMIGAGSILLPGSKVAPNEIVPAGTVLR